MSVTASTTVAAIAAVALFCIAFRYSRLVTIASDVIALARRSAAIMVDAGLEDDTKERAVQDAAKRLFVRFFEITFRAAVVLAIPVAALFLLDAADLVSFERVVDLLLRWEVIAASTIAVVAVGLIWR